jgi:hypothetical protein
VHPTCSLTEAEVAAARSATVESARARRLEVVAAATPAVQVLRRRRSTRAEREAARATLAAAGRSIRAHHYLVAYWKPQVYIGIL